MSGPVIENPENSKGKPMLKADCKHRHRTREWGRNTCSFSSAFPFEHANGNAEEKDQEEQEETRQ